MKKSIKIFLLFLINLSFAQTLSSSLSKDTIDLGEVITMKINVQNLQGKEVISAKENALLPFNFESYSDSIQMDNEQYIRTIKFTIFNEGNFSIPALEFKVGDSIYHTIPYDISVYNSANIIQDDEINDIMENEEIELSLYDYWELYQTYIILGIIAILGLLYLYFSNGKKYFEKTNEIKDNKNKDYRAIALKSLEELQNKNYPEKGESRLFYIELLEITRNFLNGKYDIPANILLTEDLIDFLQTTYMANKWQTYMQDVLTRGDFAKFGKYNPPQNIMDKDFSKIKHMISTMKDHL